MKEASLQPVAISIKVNIVRQRYSSIDRQDSQDYHDFSSALLYFALFENRSFYTRENYGSQANRSIILSTL